LVETLEAYLDRAGDVKATAEALNLHRATLYYRLQRIEEITGARLRSGRIASPCTSACGSPGPRGRSAVPIRPRVLPSGRIPAREPGPLGQCSPCRTATTAFPTDVGRTHAVRRPSWMTA
jgi:hypothetical protein